jgi:hypothetical protein
MIRKLIALLIILTAISLLNCRDYNLTQVSNTPPNSPSIPIPADGEIGVSTSPTLIWYCSDSDAGDSLRFDIYFGQYNPPDSIIVANWNLPSYNISGLDTNKTYFWKVVAKDNNGGVAVGNVWRFTTYPSIPTDGLIAYYPFEGNAIDASGNGNDGILKGNFQFVNSINNLGVRLISETGSDSLGGYVLLPNLHFKSMNSFSYALWVSEEVLLGDEFYIFFKDNPNSEDYAGIFRSKSMSYIDFQVGANTQNLPLTVNFPSSFKNHFIHYCLVSEHDTLKMFINGAFIKQKYQTAIVDGATSAIAFHSVADMVYTRFTGIIDEVRVYNRAITNVEVKALYNGMSKH